MTNNAHASSEVVCRDLEVAIGALKSLAYVLKKERELCLHGIGKRETTDPLLAEHR